MALIGREWGHNCPVCNGLTFKENHFCSNVCYIKAKEELNKMGYTYESADGETIKGLYLECIKNLTFENGNN